jgi:type II restriction/modification system DNA methylase subunit YeeA
MVKKSWMRPADLTAQLRELFNKMAKGGWFGAEEILHFNGGLFDDDTVFDLDSDVLSILGKISDLDWSSIEPSIFGTLFARSLDPSKRSQIGAHFTSRDDILLVVEPVLMAPLRRRWKEIEAQARSLAARRDQAKGAQKAKLHNELRVLLMNFAAELAQIRVLDPGCGSGNFLYVALRQLLDLEKQVIMLASELGIGQFFPTVSPTQVYGIEINPYAHKLAQATVWIGYIQWLRENGYGRPSEPILKRLDNIKEMDAILAYDANGKPIEPEWVEADAVVGNPPFLGGNKIRQGLGDKYVDDLFALYKDRIPATADLVTYWFEKARAMIEQGNVKRAGLLATQGIRGGANRQVLERIKKSGDIFWAQSDRVWILDGAAVRVSMVGFDNGAETARQLDSQTVANINANLTATANIHEAKSLPENADIGFVGSQKAGAFDIPSDLARKMLAAKGNPNRRPNSDVVKPSVNGDDITKTPREMWIIDFGVDMSIDKAAQYEMPFEYIRHYRDLVLKRENDNI